ncbi:MAG: septum formation initiator family protein [Candidatus Nanopelagicales bacterium]|jgi:cell division protein FtsB
MAAARTPWTGRAVILLCVLAALVITLAIPVRELLSQRGEIDQLRTAVELAEVQVDDLNEQVSDWQDPAYITAQARSRLHFVFPGEVGYVVLGADDRPLDPERIPQTEVSGTWFERGWAALRTVDEGVTGPVEPATAP